MALLLEAASPARRSGAIFVWRGGGVLLQSWEQLICMLYCQLKPLTPSLQESLQSSLLLYIYRPEFSLVSHLSRQRAKHVHLPPFGQEGKLKRCASPASLLHSSSSLHCNHRGEWVAYCIYQSFIEELMHRPAGRVPTLAVITLARDTLLFHMGSHSLSFCLIVFNNKYC